MSVFLAVGFVILVISVATIVFAFWTALMIKILGWIDDRFGL